MSRGSLTKDAELTGRLRGGKEKGKRTFAETVHNDQRIALLNEPPPRPFVVQCRKCGVPNSCSFQVSNIKDGKREHAFAAELVVLLACRACGYAIDRCDIHVIVSGIGTWQVLKKHIT